MGVLIILATKDKLIQSPNLTIENKSIKFAIVLLLRTISKKILEFVHLGLCQCRSFSDSLMCLNEFLNADYSTRNLIIVQKMLLYRSESSGLSRPKDITILHSLSIYIFKICPNILKVHIFIIFH